MPAKRPSASVLAMLVEDDIALWDYHNFNIATGRPTQKDPVRAVLMTPRAPDRQFSGTGPTTDEAIMDALARNPALRADEGGLLGAACRLANALHELEIKLWRERERLFIANGGDELDFDVPF